MYRRFQIIIKSKEFQCFICICSFFLIVHLANCLYLYIMLKNKTRQINFNETCVNLRTCHILIHKGINSLYYLIEKNFNFNLKSSQLNQF